MIEPFIEEIVKLIEKYSYKFEKDSKIVASINVDYSILESDNDRLEMLVDGLGEKLYYSDNIKPSEYVHFPAKDIGENFICYFDEKLFVVSFTITQEHYDYMYELQINCMAENLYLRRDEFWK